MPAPLKNHNQQTGNFAGLVVMLVIFAIIAGILIHVGKLPAYVTTYTTQNTQPQVAGESTTSEYVPAEDTTTPTAPTADTNQTFYPIVSISDGDTVKASINGKVETIRLIGVDTPETKDPRKPIQCYGKEASDYTTKVLTGKNVRLVADDSQQNRDKYGRLLRYIFLQDGTLFNQLLIESGYAYEYTYRDPYKYQTAFKSAAAQAQADQIGLWSPLTCTAQNK